MDRSKVAEGEERNIKENDLQKLSKEKSAESRACEEEDGRICECPSSSQLGQLGCLLWLPMFPKCLRETEQKG